MKRLLDVIIALFAGAVFLVPMILIAISIRITSKGPSIYWSTRMGRCDQPFAMPKFRTMHLEAPIKPTEDLQNPERYITGIGKILRKTSLDELPQIYSVLCGRMSIVGPRPVLVSQTELIEERRRAGVGVLRPGITGWAQINGRDNIGQHDKVRFDAQYLERQSVFFDILIIWRTIFYVLRLKGVWH